jgi:hypothetical protein
MPTRLAIALAAATLLFAEPAHALSVATAHRSPKNPERPVRKSTELIVLHTTEAPAKSALRHLSERGEAHYCVTEDGVIHAIVDRHRVAFHSGCSMWNGREEVDNFSIGIECVGYHDKAMPLSQLNAVKTLVKEMQRIYSIPDERVVTHSMVAYGKANKWHKRDHRGRKRCGMLFAMPSVRRVLDLKRRAAFDPDTKSRRLAVADDYLNKVLYGNVDTMIAYYRPAPPAKSAFQRLPQAPKAATATAKSAKPAPQKTAKTAKAVAPAPKAAKPAAAGGGKGGKFAAAPQSIAELKKLGFASVGSVSRKRLPSQIAGARWNSPDTYYTLRGKVTPGNILDQRHVEEGMNVWMKRK